MRRFLTPGWLVKHVAMIVLVAIFLSLGWWQLSRARSGNMLSYGYAAQWPLFALFVFGVWVREVRAELRPAGTTPTRPGAEPAGRPVVVPVAGGGVSDADADDDPALRAYNDYLAWLAANPHRRPADYRPTAQPGTARG